METISKKICTKRQTLKSRIIHHERFTLTFTHCCAFNPPSVHGDELELSRNYT